MNVGVVVLAAGEGRRLGLGPKAHVLLGGESFLSRVVRTCRAAGLDAIWVVGSPTDTMLSAACEALSVHAVINARPELGMSSSVHVGLRATQGKCSRGVLVFPVDLPLVQPSTLIGLLAGMHDDACVRPRVGQRHGHPIALGTGLVTKLLALDPSTPLRVGLDLLRARMIDVRCGDAATLDNVNTLADLTRLQQALDEPS